MNAPIITFRKSYAPYDLLTPMAYVQNSPAGDTLPVLSGETSNVNSFRIYNNFGLSANCADAINVQISCYDGSGSNSKTTSSGSFFLATLALRRHSVQPFDSFKGGDSPYPSPDPLIDTITIFTPFRT